MKSLVALLLLSFLLLASLGLSAADLVPSESQKLKLENAQLKARISLIEAQGAASRFAEIRKAFDTTCAEVIKENKWPEGATCNPDSLAIVPPEVKAVAPVAPTTPTKAPPPVDAKGKK